MMVCIRLPDLAHGEKLVLYRMRVLEIQGMDSGYADLKSCMDSDYRFLSHQQVSKSTINSRVGTLLASRVPRLLFADKAPKSWAATQVFPFSSSEECRRHPI